MRKQQRWVGLVLSVGLGASGCSSEAGLAPASPNAALASTSTGVSPGATTTTAPSPAPAVTTMATSAPASGGAAAGPKGVAAPVSGTSPTPPVSPGVPPSSGEAAAKPPVSTGQPPAQSGLLTAGSWDDNRNFDRFKRYRARLLQAQLQGALPTTDAEHEAAHKRFEGELKPHQQLDISLVIDTTGSMGDEIRYLQTEFMALSNSIEELYPDSDQRWSLVVYRDKGDAYVAKDYDFQSEVSAFRDRLAEQSAGGGNDFPEAPEAAFQALTQLDWRNEDGVARLAFWVADAPHHAENAKAMADAIRDTANLDVHIYPVASSGIDDLTELSMRSAAQLSGGRYLFLTDDSGVGGPHAEPTIPCYFVTRLDQAILRMVSIELTGQYEEPAADEVIRTGGDPKSGRCKLESGEEVQSF